MATEVMAVGAAAVAYYAYRRSRQGVMLRNGIIETHKDVAQAPSNWTGELYLFAEGLRYIWVEFFGRWPTADLFIGLFYLANQGMGDFPAKHIVTTGKRVYTASLSQPEAKSLKIQLKEIRRLLLYSQNLKYAQATVPEEVWAELGLEVQDFVVHRPRAAVLCPAFVLVCDHQLHELVMAIRGTKSVRDIFTSLSGAPKPHHVVDQNGVVLGYSHFGMLAAARWLLKEAGPFIKEATLKYPGYRLRITGHSMGAGTAAMLTMMLREQHPEFGDVQCTAFACPGCMTLELAQSCASYVTSIVYGTDVVPTTSPAALDQLRDEVAGSSWGSAFRQDVRSSRVFSAVEGSIRGVVKSASSWTSRSIESATWGLRACYGGRCTGPRHSSTPTNGNTSQGEPGLVHLINDLEAAEAAAAGPSDATSDNHPEEEKLSTEGVVPLDEVIESESANDASRDGSRMGTLPAGKCCELENQPAAIMSDNLTQKTSTGAPKDAGQMAESTTYQRISTGMYQFGSQLQRTGGMMAEYSSSLWSRMIDKNGQAAPEVNSASEERRVPLLETEEPTSPGLSSARMSSALDVENLSTGKEMDLAEEEGVFDGRSIQEDKDHDTASSSTPSFDDIRKRRQLYPAGRILHLVPAYILEAESRQGSEAAVEKDVLQEMEALLINETAPSGSEGRAQTQDREAGEGSSSHAQNISKQAANMDTCELPVSTHMSCSDHDETSPCHGQEEDDLRAPSPSGSTCPEKKPDGKEYVLFMDVPQESYSKMRMCRSMVMDHFLPRYRTAIESMIEELKGAANES